MMHPCSCLFVVCLLFCVHVGLHLSILISKFSNLKKFPLEVYIQYHGIWYQCINMLNMFTMYTHQGSLCVCVCVCVCVKVSSLNLFMVISCECHISMPPSCRQTLVVVGVVGLEYMECSVSARTIMPSFNGFVYLFCLHILQGCCVIVVCVFNLS